MIRTANDPYVGRVPSYNGAPVVILWCRYCTRWISDEIEHRCVLSSDERQARASLHHETQRKVDDEYNERHRSSRNVRRPV